MRKIFLTLTAAALVLGVTALSAGAQTQAPGAGNLQGQAHNFTPLVKEAACNGMWGPMVWSGMGAPVLARSIRWSALPLRALLVGGDSRGRRCVRC